MVTHKEFIEVAMMGEDQGLSRKKLLFKCMNKGVVLTS